MSTSPVDHSIRDHARRAPSDSKRWTACTSALDYENMFALAASSKAGTLTAPGKDTLNELLLRFNTTYEEAASVGYSSRDETVYNVEGTEAHEWAEKVLTGTCTIDDVPVLYPATGKAMRSAVATYIFECEKIASETDGMEPFIEAKVPLFYNKAETGTMDFAVVSQTRVRVRDYKHGIGIFVKVDDNTQLAIYTLSFMQMLEDDGYYTFDPDTEVEIGVVQPRHREWQPDHYWTLTYADLKAFCKTIQKAHDIIDEGIETVFAPSYDACFFCRLKAFCGARLHHMAQGLPSDDGRTEAEFLEGLPDYDDRGSQGKFEKSMPDELDRINHYAESYGVIPVEQMVRIFANKKGIIAFLEDIGKYLTRRALEGDAAPGTKLVIGREGNSEWTDEEAAEKLLENQGFQKHQRCNIEIISVSKARELLGDKINTKKKNNPMLSPRLVKAFDPLVTRSPGKKVLALESDKREAVDSNLSDFDDLDELDETAGME